MTDVTDTLSPDGASSPAPKKRKLGRGRVMPLPGALERAYRNKANTGAIRRFGVEPPKRGIDYLTKNALMREIGQEPSAFRNINIGRNAMTIADAITLADLLDTDVERLVTLDPFSRGVADAHQRKRLAERRGALDDAWVKRMGAFPLPLKARPLMEVAADLAKMDRMHIAVPPFDDVDLPTAHQMEELPTLLDLASEHARRGETLFAAKMIEDFVHQLGAKQAWRLLSARYVRRDLVGEDPIDSYGGSDIRARKMLLVRLSLHEAEPDFVLDRTAESREESNQERWDEHDPESFAELEAWGGPRFWQDIAGWAD